MNARERLADARCRVDRLKDDYRASRTDADRQKALLMDAQAALKESKEARDIARTVGEAVQRRAHDHVAGLVTRCLSAVFGPDAYRFEIKLEKKRNRTEGRAVFLRKKREVDPLTAAGGGVVDVAAFALRLAVILLRHPKPRRFVCLDEPFKMLSQEYRPRVGQLLKTLADELGFQFLLISHATELEIGKVVRVSPIQKKRTRHQPV